MRSWTETADVVDHVPHLVGRQLAAVGTHTGVFHAVADDGEDLGVTGAVLPVRAAQVSRPRIHFLSHRSVALPVIAMAARALAVVDLLASRERRRVGRDRVRQFRILQLMRGQRDGNETTRDRNDERAEKMAHRSTPRYIIIAVIWAPRNATPCCGANR